MFCEEISETWTARPCRLKTVDFFDSLADKPFTFLYGDGPQARWIMLGEEPLAVVREAHALKGSCGTLGAVELLALSTEMELRAKANDLSLAQAQLGLIDAAFQSALRELEALVMRG